MLEFNRDELIELADAAIEGQLTGEQLSRLEHLVTSNSTAAATYVDYVALDASLRIAKGAPVELPRCGSTSNQRDSGKQLASLVVAPEPRAAWQLLAAWTKDPRFLSALLAIAATLFVFMGVWLLLSGQTKSIATLMETKGCKWDAGTLPTELGAQLTQGRLRLAQGLARIVFRSGAEVLLESPAELELISPMKCKLRSGKLVASVPEGAQGFVVETPSSIVTDFGTRFGVTVGQDEAAVVQVFQGRVDTLHRRTGHTEVMYEGSVVYFGDSGYRPHQNAEQSSNSDDTRPISEPKENWIQISTAQGRGQDAYVQPQQIPDHHLSKGLLLVKRPAPKEDVWERRAYLRFDLGDIKSSKVVKAELSLTCAPTGLGYASLVPDATFHVYGLADGQGEKWSGDKLNWENAPACVAATDLKNDSRIELLGRFVIPQGEQSSTVLISNPALTNYLNADTNQLATLIVVRETEGQGPSDLVHGFASRQHSSLPPPTLRMKLSDL